MSTVCIDCDKPITTLQDRVERPLSPGVSEVVCRRCANPPTPCPVADCPASAEEHHRVNVGLVAENAELRRRAREARPDAADLTEIGSRDLLAELTRRVSS